MTLKHTDDTNIGTNIGTNIDTNKANQMGWKAVKEYFGIDYIVYVSGDDIAIGSDFVPEIITISRNGDVTVDGRHKGYGTVKKLVEKLEENHERLVELIRQRDTFSADIPVYTYGGGKILEYRCERLGYPNVTHCGKILYDNMFSADKQYVLEQATKNAVAYSIMSHERHNKAKQELDAAQRELNESLDELSAYSMLRTFIKTTPAWEGCDEGCDDFANDMTTYRTIRKAQDA